MSGVKLWYLPGACSLASHVLLYEAGTTFETIKLDIDVGHPEEFRHLNPKMRVPVLSIEQDVITETPAIMTAIFQLHPDLQLMGQNNLEIVRVYEWLNWLLGTLHGQAFGGLVRLQRYSDDISAHKGIKANSFQPLEECFQKIKDEFEGIAPSW